jgi:Coenzyme PQQ synthesis protein D (PqqD)
MKERPFPRARLDCLSRGFDTEVLIYDPERHIGHCLNSTAAAVWKLCDGNNSTSQIARALSHQLSAPVDETVVLLALDQLAGAHLLVQTVAPVKSLSRRDAIGRIGIAAAIALPLVTSIVAPTPARAASCLHNGQPCSSNANCCSGHCNGSSHRCSGG